VVVWPAAAYCVQSHRCILQGLENRPSKSAVQSSAPGVGFTLPADGRFSNPQNHPLIILRANRIALSLAYHLAFGVAPCRRFRFDPSGMVATPFTCESFISLQWVFRSVGSIRGGIGLAQRKAPGGWPGAGVAGARRYRTRAATAARSAVVARAVNRPCDRMVPARAACCFAVGPTTDWERMGAK